LSSEELAIFRDAGELRIRVRIYDEDGGVRIEEEIGLLSVRSFGNPVVSPA
jgi:hypothetical protein